jgi:membrane-bound ClpP family serine protease
MSVFAKFFLTFLFILVGALFLQKDIMVIGFALEICAFIMLIISMVSAMNAESDKIDERYNKRK